MQVTITRIDPNKKIATIKAVRHLTGCRLSEAKHTVENLPATFNVLPRCEHLTPMLDEANATWRRDDPRDRDVAYTIALRALATDVRSHQLEFMAETLASGPLRSTLFDAADILRSVAL